MSLVKTKAIQMGFDATPTNNFLIYQPLTPDGTFRIANGNQGATTDIMTVTSGGSVTFAGTTNFSSLNFGAGSESAPSLFPTGDSNTGIWFPAADTFAVSTGGTQRLRINSSGYVGIGTDPVYSLDIATPNSGNIAWQRTGVSAKKWAISSDNYATYFGNVTDAVWNILTLQNAGNVGIGTGSPNAKLEVYGQRIRINATPDPGIELADTTNVKGYFFYDTTNGNVKVRHSASGNGITVNSSGYVGIATDSPATSLHVQGKARIFDGGYPYLDLGITTSNYFRILHDNPNDVFTIGKNGSAALSINGGGRVGIGTNAPSGVLNIVGAGNAPGGTLMLSGSKSNNTGKWSTIAAEQYANTTEPEGYTIINATAGAGTNGIIIGGGLDEQNAATVISFRTAGNEATRSGTTRMVINNGGRVGINTESPTATLEVAGGIAVTGWSNNNSGSAGGVEFGWDGTQTLLQSYNRVGNVYTPVAVNGSHTKILSNGSETARFTSSGLSIGTTAATQQLVITGGIGFANWNSSDKKLYSPLDGCLEWFTHTAAGAHSFAVSHQGTQRVSLDASGQIYAVFTSIASISDINQKENIRPLGYGLAEVEKLQPFKFDYKETDVAGGGKDNLGFSAQDVADVIPELVGERNGTLTLKMGDLIPVLVKAIQEQQEIIESLKARLDAAGL